MSSSVLIETLERPPAAPGESAAALPLLVVGSVSTDHLRALAVDRRLCVFQLRRLTRSWSATAARLSATLVLAKGDPVSALRSVRALGLRGRIVLAIDADRARHADQALRAGALAWVTIPLSREHHELLVGVLRQYPTIILCDTRLRCVLDAINRVALGAEWEVALTQREFALLHCLCSHRDNPVSTTALLREVWQADDCGRARQRLEFHVSQLRKKLDRVGLRDAISTIPRFGYQLVPVARAS